MGLQFENFVLNNFQLLAKEIGLVGKNVESVAPYFRKGGKCGPGVQIDMLVQLPCASREASCQELIFTVFPMARSDVHAVSSIVTGIRLLV
jgi:hypothetical protein